MTNKKLEAKRLVIFLLLAFGISWIPAPMRAGMTVYCT